MRPVVRLLFVMLMAISALLGVRHLLHRLDDLSRARKGASPGAVDHFVSLHRAAKKDRRGRLLVPATAPPLFAIADIHGDLPRARRALAHAGVVSPKTGDWTAGAATLVQTGDIVDRGPDTLAIYNMTATLAAQASEQGGSVVRLLGNHEYMNALLDWRYVDPADTAKYPHPSASNRVADWSARRDFPVLPSSDNSMESSTTGERMLVDYGVTYLDPVYGAHFMHAGLSRGVVEAGMRVDAIGQEFLHGVLTGRLERNSPPSGADDPSRNKSPHPSPWKPKHRAFWAGEEGPMWYRGFAVDTNEKRVCEEADWVLDNLWKTAPGVKERSAKLRFRQGNFLVMGHTPQFDGALVRCSGRVLLIDTGMSRAYGGRAVVLELAPSPQPLGHRPSFELEEPGDDQVEWREVGVRLHYDDTKTAQHVPIHTEL
ncbi:hypothetical protein PYCC9005_002774 [Savitreella phatthalungensis]